MSQKEKENHHWLNPGLSEIESGISSFRLEEKVKTVQLCCLKTRGLEFEGSGVLNSHLKEMKLIKRIKTKKKKKAGESGWAERKGIMPRLVNALSFFPSKEMEMGCSVFLFFIFPSYFWHVCACVSTLLKIFIFWFCDEITFLQILQIFFNFWLALLFFKNVSHTHIKNIWKSTPLFFMKLQAYSLKETDFTQK